MKHRTLVLLATSGALTLSQVATAAPHPDAKLWSGTWQLNSGESKFSSAQYTPKKDTRTYKVSGNRITMHSSMVTGGGKTMSWGYSAAANGRWYSTSGNPGADHIALTLVSARELRSETRLKGKTSANATVSVSDDGKHLTVKRSLAAPKGATDDTVVYDRTK